MKKKFKPMYPEPGTWLLDMPPGMPKPQQPDFPPGKVTTQEIRDIHVPYEGLGYCLMYLFKPEKIEDKALRKLWLEARESMFRVLSYLEALPQKPLPKKKVRIKKLSTRKSKHAKKKYRPLTVVDDLGEDTEEV